ncbi:MAG: hypothetical protein EXQ79_03335 [Acidimicrobiia bacterium]|nr:hypothetical protein [Acidimicrobiia bacterium]
MTVSRTTPSATVTVLALLLVLAAPLNAAGALGATRTTAPVYEDTGPYAVGFVDVPLGDQVVSVTYPALPTDGPHASYTQSDALPADLRSIVPPAYNAATELDAVVGAPGAVDDGPFPVVLLAHGAAGFRLDNSELMTRIASWGFVVAATDYPAYGRAAQVRASLSGETSDRTFTKADVKASQRASIEIMLASLDAVIAAGDDPASQLHDVIDAKRAAAVGLSLGGGVALAALGERRIDTAVGWAPVTPYNAGSLPAKPVMVMGGSRDIAVEPKEVAKLFKAMTATPKRSVTIGRAGHNSFTDTCRVIAAGGGLIAFARDAGLISGRLLDLGENGCQAGDLPPDDMIRAVTHYTVAHLRDALGIDHKPRGLDQATARAFPGVKITLRERVAGS